MPFGAGNAAEVEPTLERGTFDLCRLHVLDVLHGFYVAASRLRTYGRIPP